MAINEHKEMPMRGEAAQEPLKHDLAQNQGEFERRLKRAETKAFWRTAVSVIALVAIGMGVLLYSVQRARQEAENSLREAHMSHLQTLHFEAELQQLRQSLSNSREAVQYVTQGINLYHSGNYLAAVKAYDESLRLDPKNPYVLDLKGYSLFKLRDYPNAISALHNSIAIQPEYAWGYFDLARVYCADKRFDLASESIKSAVQIRPELTSYIRQDGEFQRLCAPIHQTFDNAPRAPSSVTTPQSAASSIRSAIDKISNGQHQELPQLAQTPAGPGQKPGWSTKNETPYTLDLYMSGPVARKYSIYRGRSIEDNLPPGTYQVAVEASAQNVIPLYSVIKLDANTWTELRISMKPD